MPAAPHLYDLALSFAGEDRAVAEHIARGLKPDYVIFYDDFERNALWGKDLTVELPLRYEASRYCLMLISDAYLRKMWTILERQTIIVKFLRDHGGNDFLLPVRLDGCTARVPGLSEATVYLEIDSHTERDELLARTRDFLAGNGSAS